MTTPKASRSLTGGGGLPADSKRIGCAGRRDGNESKPRAKRQKGFARMSPASGHEKGRPKAALDLFDDSLTRAPDQKK